MVSRRAWLTTVATAFTLSVVVPSLPGAWAQTTHEQAQCPSSWDWSDNSLTQDPCLVSAMLDAACRGYGQWIVPKANSTQYYIPPSSDIPYDFKCLCNSVQYSLLMACAECQGAEIYPWTGWAASCDNVSVGPYPYDVPYGTAIPHWAAYDVTTLPSETFNYTVAIAVGRDPEATSPAMSTLSHTSSTSSTSSTSNIPSTINNVPTHTSSSSSPTPTVSGSTTNNTPAIIGGVVGSVVPLIIFGVLVTVYLKNRKEKMEMHNRAMQDYGHFSGQIVSPPNLVASTGQNYATYSFGNGAQPAHGPRPYNGIPEI